VRLRELYRRLGDSVAVQIVTGNFPGARDGAIHGIPYIRRGMARPYALSRITFARAATRMLGKGDYDAAVFDFSAYSPVFIPQGRPVGIMLGQLVGPTSRRRWGRALGGAIARWERRQLRRARFVSAVSRALADQARPLLAPDAHVSIVGAGVPDDLFEIERRESDFLLFLGRFDVFQKGIDILMEALDVVAARHPTLRFRVLGRGRDESRVRDMARASAFGARMDVVVDPPPAQIRSALSGALAAIVPSRFEGFGMVAAEAMAAAVPVIASDIPALREVVDQPRGGMLFPEGDVAALARAIDQMVTDNTRRHSISQSARVSARRFDWNAIAASHLAFLHEIASLSASRSPTLSDS